jgi:hypothetical protein
VTNYACYKGSYPSHIDGNYHDIYRPLPAHQLTARSRYRGLNLLGLQLRGQSRCRPPSQPARRLSPPLPRTLPTFHYARREPSIYHCSGFGLIGVKTPDDDWHLRPALDLERLRR